MYLLDVIIMSVQRDSYAWLWVTLVIVAIIAGIVFFIYEMTRPRVMIHLGDGIFTARVAITDSERQKGLSGVDNLPKDKVMLFVFPEDGKHGIWMKDMKIPLDIVWLDSDRRVIYIARDVLPDSYPEVYRPNIAARYVIELAAGTVQEKQIRIGTIAQFNEKMLQKGGTW